jgi:hypothetical protein
MCGRYRLSRRKQIIEECFEAAPAAEFYGMAKGEIKKEWIVLKSMTGSCSPLLGFGTAGRTLL